MKQIQGSATRDKRAIARFEVLDVWKKATRLSADLYKSMADLKGYGYHDQITRAGLSIPSKCYMDLSAPSAADQNDQCTMSSCLLNNES